MAEKKQNTEKEIHQEENIEKETEVIENNIEKELDISDYSQNLKTTRNET